VAGPIAEAGTAAVLARSTVIAAGSVNTVQGPAGTVDFEGGPFGSACPGFRAGCHWYSVFPDVVIATGPANASPLPASASWNVIRTAWASLFTTRSDQSPSGHSIGYAVTNTFLCASLKSLAARNSNARRPSAALIPERSFCAAKYWETFGQSRSSHGP